MVLLADQDIQTREVLDWKGVHLLHFAGSSCSQKTRIFLRLKGIPWTSHHVNLAEKENYTEWFMGINPRGLVPVLIDDGQVIIESNDILQYLEGKFPTPALLPDPNDPIVKQLLDEEDELHLDLRSISMRYFFPGAKSRPADLLEKYQQMGSGTVGGVADPHKAVQVKFFEEMAANDGITDAQITDAVDNFRKAFDGMDARLKFAPYLLGDDISLLDIAWYIYAVRLHRSGYPLHALHPRLGEWYDQLDQNPEFKEEVMDPPPLVSMRAAMHEQQNANNASLVDVGKLA